MCERGGRQNGLTSAEMEMHGAFQGWEDRLVQLGQCEEEGVVVDDFYWNNCGGLEHLAEETELNSEDLRIINGV